MPDRFRARCQAKTDTLAPEVGRLVVGLTSSHRKIPTVSKPEQREGRGLKTIRSAAYEEEKEGEGGRGAHTGMQTGTRTLYSTVKLVLYFATNSL
jgi:hypothetical protein